ncbi:MAG TPA: proton-conducting transporter membrane subunit, partial [Candidatus Methylomirabilis sp.]|nr:proton-conducting transporter membrane subunit [Candidatus Methylomirabilis sp.]
ALGVGAWGAAMFHFMTHACFKALLFLAAGVIIQALHEEHDIFRMGGLREELPLVFWTFLLGGAALAGFPLVTAGFYSKDLILAEAWSAGPAGRWLWAVGWLGALLTAVYIFRVIFIVFFGAVKTKVVKRPGNAMRIPLLILAGLSVMAGFVETPQSLGHVTLFSRFISTALPLAREGGSERSVELMLSALAIAASLGGIALAWLLFRGSRRLVENLVRTDVGGAVHRFWLAGWGFDWLYDVLIVQPFLWLARANKQDVLDAPYQGMAYVSLWSYRALRTSQTGNLRWYAAVIATGSVMIVALALLL